MVKKGYIFVADSREGKISRGSIILHTCKGRAGGKKWEHVTVKGRHRILRGVAKARLLHALSRGEDFDEVADSTRNRAAGGARVPPVSVVLRWLLVSGEVCRRQGK